VDVLELLGAITVPMNRYFESNLKSRDSREAAVASFVAVAGDFA
jgi:hypothetical protein